MKRKSLFGLVSILLLSALACSLTGGDAERQEEGQPADSLPQSVVENGEAPGNPVEDFPPLGEEQTIDEGGFSFKTIPGFLLDFETGMALLLDPDGDVEAGPLIIMGGEESEAKTSEALLQELRDELGVTLGQAQPVDIGGKDGLATDLWRDGDDTTMRGRVAVVMAAPGQAFYLMAAAPEDQWEAFAPYAEAVLRSVAFHPLSAAQTSSGLTSGMFAYVNRNDVRDLMVDNGTLYAATLGGMVSWNLESGAMLGYTPLDGMGHISANAVTKCAVPEERVIVGTLTGLSIFDPSSAVWEQRHLTPEDSRVAVNKVERLFCDAENGRLLLGYSGLGVLDIKSGAFTQYNTSYENLLWNSVADVAVDGEDIWVASGYNGITLIQGEDVTFFNEENGLPDGAVHALAFAPDGSLWAGASDGLMHYQGNQWTLYGSDTPARLSSLSEIEISPEGDIWVASASLGGGRLCLFDPQQEECVVDRDSADGNPVYALALTDDGHPVYATHQGIYLFDGSTDRAYLCERDQLASNFVDSFAAAADGSLWIGTDNGMHLIDPANPDGEWQTFTREETPGLGGNWVSDIALGEDGATWFAIINGSASRLKDGVWTGYQDVYSFYTVAVDAEGNAWFGDDGKGILVLDADGNLLMEMTTANSALPSDNVRVLLAQDDSMWIGTGEGLAKYQDGTLQVIFDKEDMRLLSPFIRDLKLDDVGALIIGTNASILRYDGNQVEVLFELKAMGVNDSLTELALTRDGSPYVGTYNGLYYLDDSGEFVKMTTQDGLLTNGISALYIDQYDSVWVGGGGSNFDGGGILHLVP